MDNQGLEAGLSYIGLVLEAAERQIAEFWAAYEERESVSKREVATIKYPDRYSLKTDADRITEAQNLVKLMYAVPGQRRSNANWPRTSCWRCSEARSASAIWKPSTRRLTTRLIRRAMSIRSFKRSSTACVAKRWARWPLALMRTSIFRPPRIMPPARSACFRLSRKLPGYMPEGAQFLVLQGRTRQRVVCPIYQRTRTKPPWTKRRPVKIRRWPTIIARAYGARARTIKTNL
jgi:hypothetical protein